MPIPTPNAGESQAQFVSRCHEALADEFPETDQRNAVCFQAWREGTEGGGVLERKAVERFSAQEFEHIRDVPVFTEHTTRGRDGKAVVYDKAALTSIVQRCNERIADTGDFPPLVEGHTPDKEAMSHGVRMPDVLGYSGPFKLGQIGNNNPRWAIFQDEWHHHEDRERLRKLRRRSPEVWLDGGMEERFIDPVACLGAQTPRLDMGLTRLCLTADGRTVEKYNATFPGPANVFVPTDDLSDKDKPKKYQSDLQPKDSAMPQLTPENVAQLIDALMETAPMQWVISQMNTDSPDSLQDKETVEMDYAADDDPGDKEAIAVAADCDGKDKDKTHYTADGSAEDPAAGKPTEDADVADPALMKFAREQREERREQNAKYAKLAEENNTLKGRLDGMDHERRTADRTVRLTRLAFHYAMDPKKELDRCVKMSDPQFEDHLDVITENYGRIPVDAPQLHIEALDPPDERMTEKYRRDTSEKAMEYALRERAKDNEVSYEEALEHVRKPATAAG